MKGVEATEKLRDKKVAAANKALKKTIKKEWEAIKRVFPQVLTELQNPPQS